MRRLVLAVLTAGLLIGSTAPTAAGASATVLKTSLGAGAVKGTATLTIAATGTSAALAVKLIGVKATSGIIAAVYGSSSATGTVLAGRYSFKAPTAGAATRSFSLSKAELNLVKAAISRQQGLSVAVNATPKTGKAVRAVGSFTLPAAPDVSAALYGTAYAPASGSSGGTIAIGEWESVDQLNPYYTFLGSSAEAIAPILRGCAALAGDGKYVPDLCASLPSESNGGIVVSGDTFTMTLHLKAGLEWSDAQPLTMNDLKYTWQWANDPAQKDCYGCLGWETIDAIDVSADGLTATVHFTQPNPAWMDWLTQAILPAHYLSTIPVANAAALSYPATDAVLIAPVSGPFVITSIAPSEIDYARNPHFHAGVAASHQGGAYLDGLKILIYDDPDAELAAYRAGTIDVLLDFGPGMYAGLAATPADVGATRTIAPAASYEQITINNDPSHKRRNGLWDERVRAALALVINRTAIAKAAYPGEPTVAACSRFGPSNWYAEPVSCPAVSAPKAQALLRAAGWKVDAKGWVADAAGREMNLQLCTTTNQRRVDALKMVAANLKSVHVKATVVSVSSADFFGGWAVNKPCSIYRGNYDLAEFSWGGVAVPYTNSESYASSQWPELGQHWGGNASRFKSASMNAAVSWLGRDVTIGGMLYDGRAASAAYVAGVPEIPLFYLNEYVGVGVHAGNWWGSSTGGVGATWNVEDWYRKP